MQAVVIILSVAVMAFVVYWIRFRKKKAPARNPLSVTLPPSFPYFWGEHGQPGIQSVVEVPIAARQAVAEGILNQIVRISAAKPSWDAYKNLTDYVVYFIDPQATNTVNDPGSPALIIRGVQAAGTCIGVGNDGVSLPIIVLPHQAASDWIYLDYLMHSAWHESEHIREWTNDPAEFFARAIVDDIHPHFL